MINEVNDLLESHRDWPRGHTLVSCGKTIDCLNMK